MNQSISTMTGKTKIKIVFLGNQSVGKSSIIEKYIHDKFDQTANPTVGIDFLAKNITHKAKNYRLQLWDTAGQERFRSLIPSYLKDAHCALIVFDVTNRASLANAEMWVNLYNENKTGEGFILLIGNKIDLDYREVPYEEGKAKADQLSIPYYEISAKTGQHIQQLFIKLIDISGERNLSAVSLQQLMERKEVITQAGKDEQADVKVDPDNTTNKLGEKPANTEKVEEQQPRTVVLKNQKVVKQANKQKGCC